MLRFWTGIKLPKVPWDAEAADPGIALGAAGARPYLSCVSSSGCPMPQDRVNTYWIVCKPFLSLLMRTWGLTGFLIWVPGLGHVADNRKTDFRSHAPNHHALWPLRHRADSREGLRALILHTPFAKTGVTRHSSLTHTMHTATFSHQKARLVRMPKVYSHFCFCPS